MSIRITSPAGGAAAPRSPNWQPSDHGLITWSLDIASCANNAVLPSAGVLHVVRVHVPSATTITNILTYIATGGSGLTAGQCGAALYDVAGNRLGVTADLSGAFAVAGIKTFPLTAPVAVAAGDYYVALFANGTTLPNILRGPNIATGITNLGTTRSATGGASVTAAPATLPALTNAAPMWWVGLN